MKKYTENFLYIKGKELVHICVGNALLENHIIRAITASQKEQQHIFGLTSKNSKGWQLSIAYGGVCTFTGQH